MQHYPQGFFFFSELEHKSQVHWQSIRSLMLSPLGHDGYQRFDSDAADVRLDKQR